MHSWVEMIIISLSTRDSSFRANDKSLNKNDVSLRANDISLGANEISLGANNVSLGANNLSLGANDLLLGANNKSYRTQQNIVTATTIAIHIILHNLYRSKLIIVQISPIYCD